MMSTVLQLKKKKACFRFDAVCGRDGLGQLQGAPPLNWGAGAQLLPHAVTWHFHPHCEPGKSGTKGLAPPPQYLGQGVQVGYPAGWHSGCAGPHPGPDHLTVFSSPAHLRCLMYSSSPFLTLFGPPLLQEAYNTALLSQAWPRVPSPSTLYCPRPTVLQQNRINILFDQVKASFSNCHLL